MSPVYTAVAYAALLDACDMFHDDNRGSATFYGPTVPADAWLAPQCRRPLWIVTLTACPVSE